MFDATNNCIQVAAACAAGVTPSIAQNSLNASGGWYITLGVGEKVVGNALALGGTVFFNTNQPDAGAGGGTCGSNLGIARQYQVSATDATATSTLTRLRPCPTIQRLIAARSLPAVAVCRPPCTSWWNWAASRWKRWFQVSMSPSRRASRCRRAYASSGSRDTRLATESRSLQSAQGSSWATLFFSR